MVGKKYRPGCIVNKCPNNPRDKKIPKGKVIFFPISKEQVKNKKWVQILSLVAGLEKENSLEQSCICSLHFLEKDFEVNIPRQFRLKRDAVPSVNLDLDDSGNNIAETLIRNENATLGVGINRDSGYASISESANNKGFTSEFFNDLKTAQKGYISVSTNVLAQQNDGFLKNLVVDVKKDQLCAIKHFKSITPEHLENLEQSLYLFVEEEKNRTYSEIKSNCLGRCRLCLCCFQKPQLFLFSARLVSDMDMTIKDYFMSLFPFLSDNFKSDHKICHTCYEHLLITLHFCKMVLSAERLLNTVLKNQPFIFVEKENINCPSSPERASSCGSDIIDNDKGSSRNSPIFKATSNLILNNYEEDFMQQKFAIDGAELISDHNTSQCQSEGQLICNFDRQQTNVSLVKMEPENSLMSLESLDDVEKADDNFDTPIDIKPFSKGLGNTNNSDNLHNYGHFEVQSSNNVADVNIDNKIHAGSALRLPPTESVLSLPGERFDMSRLTESAGFSDFNVTLTETRNPERVILDAKGVVNSVDKLINKRSTFNDNRCISVENSNTEDIHLKPIIDLGEENYACNLALGDIFTDIIKNEPNIRHIDLNPCNYQQNSNFDNTPNEQPNPLNDYYGSDEWDSVVPSVKELKLIKEIGHDANLQNRIHFTVITPSILDPLHITDSFENLKVVHLDSNVSRRKRLIFFGTSLCRNCNRSKVLCYCRQISRRGGICEKCGLKLSSRSRLTAHLLKCGKISLKCERCNRTFKTKFKYERHLKNVADAPLCDYVQCNVCLVKFTTEAFKEHIIEHPNFVCPTCGKSFSLSKYLTSHVYYTHKKSSKGVKQICHLCGKMVVNLGNHVRLSHYLKNERKEICDVCNKRFRTKSNVRIHKKFSHNAKKVACSICDKKFKNLRTMQSHLAVVHVRKPIATCEICNIGFARRDYYQFHMLKHQSFIIAESEDNVSPKPRRKRTLSAVGPCNCTICKKIFNSRSQLRIHYKYFHAQLRGKCRFCDRTFVGTFNIKRHEKLHENPFYQFSCRVCFAQHKSEEELQRHIKKSHSKKPKNLYQCYHCNEPFLKKYLLTQHISDVHTPLLNENIDEKIDMLIK